MAFLQNPHDHVISEVKVNHKAAEFVSQGDVEQKVKHLEDSPTNCWYYNAPIKIFFVKVFDEPNIKIEVSYS